MKEYFRIHGNIKNIIKIFVILFGILSLLLVLACSMTTDKVKENIKKSAYKMEEEGVYPQYIVKSPYYQLDNWTEAEVLNFIYSNYEGEAIKTAFAQRHLGGYYKGRRAENDFERLIARVETKEETDELVRPSYWIGARIFLIPLLNIMDYYQIRMLFFCICIVILFITVALVCKKINVKLGLGLLGAFLLVNCPIAFLNNSLGSMCMCLTCLSILYLIYHKETQLFAFMFAVGMMTAFFEWFSLSVFSFGMTACMVVVMQYLEEADTKFMVFFNKIWNCAIGWVLRMGTMFLGRAAISFLVVGSEAFRYFTNRFTYNTGMQGGESLLVKAVLAVMKCIAGIFPVSLVTQKLMQTKNYLLLGFIVLLLAIAGISLLLAIKKRSKNPAFNCSLLLIAFSPIVWIIVFNTYYSVHFWIAYRVIGIFVFAMLCILLFGLDVGGKSYGRKRET